MRPRASAAKPEVDLVTEHPAEVAAALRGLFPADSLNERMGITITEASAERVVATMPVKGNTQAFGVLHGGASCVLAETLGSVGAAMHAGPGRTCLGIEISASHHRAIADGVVTGVATRVHGGRTLATYEIVISDEQGRRVCTARLSCLLTDARPGQRTF